MVKRGEQTQLCSYIKVIALKQISYHKNVIKVQSSADLKVLKSFNLQTQSESFQAQAIFYKKQKKLLSILLFFH